MVEAIDAAMPQRVERSTLLGRATFGLLLVVGVSAAIIAFLFAWALVMLTAGVDPMASDTWQAVLDAMASLNEWASIAAGMSGLLWLYRTVRNVSKLGHHGPALMSPAAAVFFALVLVPYGVIRDLRTRLAPDDRSLGGHLVVVWWTAWVTTVVFTGIVSWLADTDAPIADNPQLLAAFALVWSLAWTVAALLTAWTVRVISAGEARVARIAAEGTSSIFRSGVTDD